MDPSNGQHQEMATNSLENMLICTKTQQERKPRPQPEQALKCPRCDSTNTKFCYYNNYSLSQPRYFCKSCRRYWTKGGTLRNVPVGGGCRKNRRPSSSSSSKKTQDHHHNQLINPNTNPLTGFTSLGYDHCDDLNLAFARLQKQSSGQLGFDESDFSVLGNPNGIINHSSASTPFLDAIRSGFIDTQNSNFQNLYYGYGNGGINGGEVVDQNGGGVCVSGDMMLPNYDHHHHHHHHQDHINSSTTAITQAVTVTTMKQEFSNEREDSNNKVMFGFPWQISGNDVLGNSTWHGLINSPLM